MSPVPLEHDAWSFSKMQHLDAHVRAPTRLTQAACSISKGSPSEKRPGPGNALTGRPGSSILEFFLHFEHGFGPSKDSALSGAMILPLSCRRNTYHSPCRRQKAGVAVHEQLIFILSGRIAASSWRPRPRDCFAQALDATSRIFIFKGVERHVQLSPRPPAHRCRSCNGNHVPFDFLRA